MQRLPELEQSIAQRFSSSIKARIEVLCFDQVTSVLDIGKTIELPRSQQGTLIIARRQTSGRGQYGRTWIEVDQGFLACLVMRNESIKIFNLAPFSLVIALQIAHVLEEYGAKVGVKWPNDVLSEKEKRKLSGVLLESEQSPDASHSYVRVGIGVNLSGSPPGATSVEEESGNKVDLADFSARLVERCVFAYDTFKSQGFAYFLEGWRKRDLLSGAFVSLLRGDSSLEGDYLGLDEAGRLNLVSDGVLHTVSSGQLELIRYAR